MKQNFMTVEDVLEEVRSLSYSQGLYGRIYRDLIELKKEGGKRWKEFEQQINKAKLKDAFEMVRFFEE
jgi:hypothetical protein